MNKTIVRRYFEYLNCLDDAAGLMLRIAYRAAPTIMGIKPASLISFPPASTGMFSLWQKSKQDICGRLGLECLEIHQSSRRILLLFYKRQLLAKYLALKENREFLARLGYPAIQGEEDAEELLALLQKRFRTGFPHEIGLFLGYPLRDVQSFIEQRRRAAEGKQTVPAQTTSTQTAPAKTTSTQTAPAKTTSTQTAPAQTTSVQTAPVQTTPAHFCGYWKVYHNPGLAGLIFRKYDLACLMVMCVMLDPQFALEAIPYPPAGKPRCGSVRRLKGEENCSYGSAKPVWK